LPDLPDFLPFEPAFDKPDFDFGFSDFAGLS